MKKYVIKELYCEDNTHYFNVLCDDIVENHSKDIFIGGVRGYIDINYGVIKDIKDNIINYSDYDISTYYNNNIANYIIDTLKQYKNLSLKQALYISSLLKDNASSGDDIICDVLSILFNGIYEKTILRGYSQGDYMYCYYNVDKISGDYLKYIEAVLFNTGVEIYASCEMLEIDNINRDNIADFEYEGYYDYIVNEGDIADKIENAGFTSENAIYFEIKDIKYISYHKVIY